MPNRSRKKRPAALNRLTLPSSRTPPAHLHRSTRAAADLQNGTALHQYAQIPGGGDFYPNFYPTRQRSEAELLYFLVVSVKWTGLSECGTSLPSWS
jgi:hypothetical protein